MPIYAYLCENLVCAKVTDKLFKTFKAGKLYDEISCPDCGCKSKKIIVETSNPVFRGRGWARDGYQKPKN